MSESETFNGIPNPEKQRHHRRLITIPKFVDWTNRATPVKNQASELAKDVLCPSFHSFVKFINDHHNHPIELHTDL